VNKNSIDYTRVNQEKLNRGLKNFEFPPVIVIDTISHCNLKCSKCPHREFKRRPGIMSWVLYKKIVNEIAEKKPDARVWITFSGEGGILKDLPEKIAYAKAMGLTDIAFNSNGTLLNEAFSKRLVLAGLDTLMVGIDAFTDKTYRKIRVGGDLEKAVANVLLYKRLLAEHGRENQSLSVQLIQMPENEHELDDFVAFWTDHGVTIKIKPMLSWINNVEAENLLQNEDRLPCYWLCSVMAITDTGHVAFCGADLECGMPMGDASVNSLEQIWNDRLKTMRHMHLYGEWEKLPEMCAKCNDWQSGYAKVHEKE